MKNAEKANNGSRIAPPRYLSRAEKSAFWRIVKSKEQTNMPVSATATDLLADYCESRTRLAELRRFLDHILPFTQTGQASSGGWVKIVCTLISQIETATKFSHGLARDLRLVETD